jgi:hypothetical protein
MPRIISASRRTDIPAYYADWFMRQVEQGQVIYPNPINFQPVKLSLQPRDVLFIVFWTRNPHPLEKHLPRLDDLFERAYYFHFTINGMPKTMESHNPPVDVAVDAFHRLAGRYPGQVFWRYDPIVISDLTSPAYHVDQFGKLAERLAGATARCYFSFVSWYRKVHRNFAKATAESGIKFYEPSPAQRLEITSQLHKVAAAHKMTMYSCCEDFLLQAPGIAKSRCVDIETIREIAPSRYRKLRAAPTRQDCGCYESRDIGYYDSCPHGCLYCYANLNREKAKNFFASFSKNRRLPMDEN